MRTALAGFKRGKGGQTPADLLAQVGPTFRVDIGLKSRSANGETPDRVILGRQFLRPYTMTYVGTSGQVTIEEL